MVDMNTAWTNLLVRQRDRLDAANDVAQGGVLDEVPDDSAVCCSAKGEAILWNMGGTGGCFKFLYLGNNSAFGVLRKKVRPHQYLNKTVSVSLR